MDVCTIGTTKCASGDQCIAKGTMCDGSVNCGDGSDEDPDFCAGLWSYFD